MLPCMTAETSAVLVARTTASGMQGSASLSSCAYPSSKLGSRITEPLPHARSIAIKAASSEAMP